MKIDAYIPFYGAMFMGAVKGHPSYVKWAYLAALWYYWAEHCEGLKNNDGFLQEICECKDHEWPDVREALFGAGGWFYLGANDKWQQKRAREIWDEKYAMVQRRVAAANTRWGKKPPQAPPLPPASGTQPG